MITCKHCGQEIAASAKTCPHCGGKNKKPFYKKVWFWILIAVVLIAVISSQGGNKNTSSDSKKLARFPSKLLTILPTTRVPRRAWIQTMK